MSSKLEFFLYIVFADIGSKAGQLVVVDEVVPLNIIRVSRRICFGVNMSD